MIYHIFTSLSIVDKTDLFFELNSFTLHVYSRCLCLTVVGGVRGSKNRMANNYIKHPRFSKYSTVKIYEEEFVIQGQSEFKISSANN